MKLPPLSRLLDGGAAEPTPIDGYAASGAVLVTGASSGIGQAIATDLAGRGVTVIAGVRRPGDAPTGEGPGTIHELILDVGQSDQIAAAVGTVSGLLGGARLRALVNNAGISGGGPLEFSNFADVRQIVEIDLISQMEMTQAFIPLLRNHGDGRLLFTSSMTGHVAPPFLSAYAAAKHGLMGFAESMRRELQHHGIAVTTLSPGAVKTPIWDKADDLMADARERLAGEPSRLYPTVVPMMTRFIRDGAKDGIAPELVAEAARHAIYADSPRTDYVLGKEARIGSSLSAILPAKVMDRALMKMFG